MFFTTKGRRHRKKVSPQEIKHIILRYAKQLFVNNGVLPDKFFKQKLKNFITVITFDLNSESGIILDDAQIDDSGF